eukprot:3133612-Rhodomonas_salina.2
MVIRRMVTRMVDCAGSDACDGRAADHALRPRDRRLLQAPERHRDPGQRRSFRSWLVVCCRVLFGRVPGDMLCLYVPHELFAGRGRARKSRRRAERCVFGTCVGSCADVDGCGRRFCLRRQSTMSDTTDSITTTTNWRCASVCCASATRV